MRSKYVESNNINNGYGVNQVIPIYKFEFVPEVMWIDWHGEMKKFCLISVKKTLTEPGEEFKVLHPISDYIMSRQIKHYEQIGKGIRKWNDKEFPIEKKLLLVNEVFLAALRTNIFKK